MKLKTLTWKGLGNSKHGLVIWCNVIEKGNWSCSSINVKTGDILGGKCANNGWDLNCKHLFSGVLVYTRRSGIKEVGVREFRVYLNFNGGLTAWFTPTPISKGYPNMKLVSNVYLRIREAQVTFFDLCEWNLSRRPLNIIHLALRNQPGWNQPHVLSVPLTFWPPELYNQFQFICSDVAGAICILFIIST